jgi:DNA-directed RNA polymerase specialized sigma24 family protein
MVRRKALQLAGRPEFRRCDPGDLYQDLALKVWRGRDAFDPDVGCWYGFVAVVLDRHGRNLLRDRRAALARRPHTGSLQATVTAEDGVPAELAQALGQEALAARHGGQTRDFTDDVARSLDVGEALALLPDDLRPVAAALAEAGSVAGAARALGVPRGTLRHRLAPLRDHLRRHGLDRFP